MFTGYVRDITERKAAVEELRASRARIVDAADAARRRIERDLHDGAQQRLVALGLDLRFVREQIGDGHASAPVLDEALVELEEATGELRELARGIHPAILTERGLTPALRGLARRAAVPVELDGRRRGAAARPRRGRRLLPRRRGADERRPLGPGHAGHGDRDPGEGTP